MSETKQKKFAFPHTLVIIFCMIIFVAILTYIIPAGSYDRIEVDGRQVVDPNSFHYVEGNPASVFDIFVAVPSGMKQVAYIANHRQRRIQAGLRASGHSVRPQHGL